MKHIDKIFIITMLFSACSTKKEVSPIPVETFLSKHQGKEITLHTLENTNGLVCQITNFGARVVALWVPDKNGNMTDVVVGYGTGKDFVEKKEEYFGATIGRYGNRIGNGRFTLKGKEYILETNNGENHLHGGAEGFHRQIWAVEEIKDSKIVFSYSSPHMEGGYPGNVKVKVEYHLTDNNELKIEYFATTDEPTILNLTNHTYFNLKDGGQSSINNHKLTINADFYTPVDKGLIPTGKLEEVAVTPFDFRNSTSIGERIEDNHVQLKNGYGYDHNWVLNKGKEDVILAARVEEPKSGRIMEVYTSEPGIQFYGGNFLDGSVAGKKGIKYRHRTAFCLETQHFPDSPNKENFPEAYVFPEEKYYSISIYKFLNKI
ncbi:aldose epimerase family protein [Maribacter sp.]|uniref:aldose epimerase family protein n=1 Tax=Maribacter sp. TaxID=1897614 RepID=UPI0025C1DE69|nr:aldose epimerase family protein [Maribacter sp.]